MASPDYDKTVLAASVADNSSEFDMVNRQVVAINDSNGQSYNNGQITFDLTSLASSNAFMDLAGAVVTIPVKLVLTPTGGNFTASAANQYAASLKNSAFSIISSMSLSLNNQELISSQQMSHMLINYQIMAGMDSASLDAQGPSFMFAKDTNALVWSDTLGEINTGIVGAVQGLVANATRNEGRFKRCSLQNTCLVASRPEQKYTSSVLLNQQNRPIFVETDATSLTFEMMCNLPCKFLHDLFKKIGLIRGSIIRLVINTHLPSTFGYTCTSAAPSVYSNTASSTPYGFQPFQTCIGSNAAAGPPVIAAATTSFAARGTIGNSQLSVCQIRVPMCTLSPQAESRYLSKPVREVFYEDFFSNPGLKSVPAGTNTTNWLVSSGQSRLRRLVIIPQVSGNAASGNGSDGCSALNSPLSSAGGCTASPYFGFVGLNVALSGSNLWQQALDYKYNQWLFETGYSQSLNGGYDSALVTSCLSEADYQSLYSIADINLARHSAAEDEVAKSVNVTFTSASTRMQDFYIYLVYERQFKIDCGSGQLVV